MFYGCMTEDDNGYEKTDLNAAIKAGKIAPGELSWGLNKIGVIG